MRAPLSWLAEFAAVPAGMTGRQLAEALIQAGLEVETVDQIGGEITGPLVIGRVLDLVDEPQKNGKVIRWCHVDVGSEHNDPTGSRGIVCGALNFKAGDHVVVALPGTVLPGGFRIAARKTYGHISDGMICAEDELGLGTDHSGIMVLGDTDGTGKPWVVGADALSALQVRDEVLDIAVTPDMGYCLSIRGLAREAGQSLDVAFRDPVQLLTPTARQDGFPVSLESGDCPLFVALTVEEIDPHRPSPRWMQQRLVAAGMRSISLAVDITNYVMLETGQPLHAYDAETLVGGIVVRKAAVGEVLVTLDGTQRTLSGEDLVIADGSGPIGLAGVMGGESTELRDNTTTVVIEAAHFVPRTITRTARRHRLDSEASRRFERGVDPGAAYSAAHRVAEMLVELAGGTLSPNETVAGAVPAVPSQVIRADLPATVLGAPVSREQVIDVLRAGGTDVVDQGGTLVVTAPTWRPDLRDRYDFVEEVGRKIGFDKIALKLPQAPAGRGFTPAQQARRLINAALATSGFVEILTFPFIAETDLDKMRVPADDDRRRTVRLANPLADTTPLMRTTMLPGLLDAVQRNLSRSNEDLALFEAGSVFLAGSGQPAPLPAVGARPSDAELRAIADAMPAQPLMLAAVLTGAWQVADWRGPAVPVTWQHAMAFADVAAGAIGLTVTRRAVARMPWHPGRCAELLVGDAVIGHAGELHPEVCKAFGVPKKTVAAEINLGVLIGLAPGAGDIKPVSSYPVTKEDLALVVDADVPVGDLEAAVRAGAGVLLESITLFDSYTGEQVPSGKKSVAFALRFRAPDRTLTDAEVKTAREAAVAAAAQRHGAELRSF